MIYADYNGSAPVCTDVKEYLINRLNNGPFSNPNAIHSLGKKMMFGMEKCRRTIAEMLHCDSSQIYFNSGSSEGISHIFHSICNSSKDKNIIVTSGIEHSVVSQACDLYKSQGFKIIEVKTLVDGRVDINDFKNIVSTHKDQISLVSIMAANNETGVIQPYKEIGEITKSNGLIFLSDTTQYIGKTDFNFKESNIVSFGQGTFYCLIYFFCCIGTQTNSNNSTP